MKAEESLGRAVDCPSSFAGFIQDIARRRAQTQHIFRLLPFSLATLNATPLLIAGGVHPGFVRQLSWPTP